ncbi:hypothetical protein M3P05_07655 [Sansalvadorimonas sp. 2012CJ34-2]|uniref:Uncharacterized protein n=1 Tax=Parendozoicomonas callyspongiae TaxID=2942213 RepID=A0ABT0PEM1_9GAMM|nr:hypothetical protein [Sansalvadorimonas sp. 2012CJ34-2]MCL6269814.1 hypothetical protein [Sansalvadorimonas sp. 2012CJ34-2]
MIIATFCLVTIYTKADQAPAFGDDDAPPEYYLSNLKEDDPEAFFREPLNQNYVTSAKTDGEPNTSLALPSPTIDFLENYHGDIELGGTPQVPNDISPSGQATQPTPDPVSENPPFDPSTISPQDDPLENYHGGMELGETPQELNVSSPSTDPSQPAPIAQAGERPFDRMGYRVVDGPNGPELDYNPQYDERLTGEHNSNPLLGDQREYERQNMHEALHRFLNHELNPLQRDLLQEFLLEQISGPPKSTAELMAEEMRSREISPESFAQLTHIAISLYYYRNYIYQALVQHASKETPINESGLIMPHVVAMSEQLISQIPYAKPFTNLALVIPVAIKLFYDNIKQAREIDGQGRDGSDFRVKAYAASSYAVMLGLFAQASAGFLTKFTTFQSYPAGMLASAYRNWKTGDFWQVAIDGFMTLQSLKHRRGLVFAAVAATVLNHHNIPNEVESNRKWYEHPLDANYMIPTLLSICMTHDWGSSLVTGFILAMNQLLFMGRDKFLEPGHLYDGSQPYIMGFAGSAIAMAATLSVYWKNIPSREKAREGLNYLLTETADWTSYLLMIKGVVRPDWERSGFLNWMTDYYAWATLNRYHGERHIVSDNTWSSDSARIQGNEPGLGKKMSSWYSYLMGYDRKDLTEDLRIDPENEPGSDTQSEDSREEMSAWDEFNTPPETD